MTPRRGFLAVMAAVTLLAGCAGAGTPTDAQGNPLEALTVTTSVLKIQDSKTGTLLPNIDASTGRNLPALV